MKAQERLLATARAELGYLEKATNAQLDDKTANAGSNNWTKFARDLDNLGDVFNGRKNGYDWCGVFATWCFVRTFGKELGQKLLCQPPKSLAAGVRYAANYFKSKGQFHTSGPQPADQIFFYGSTTDVWQHTGLVEKVEGGKVYTIEGNTTGASGVVYNGGGVARKSYALNYSRIAGYGRPDWTLVKEEDDDMDVSRFKELWREMRKELQDNDSSAWSAEAREWAISSGLVQGGGAESANYMWEDVMTREQMVTLLYRFAQMLGKV